MATEVTAPWTQPSSHDAAYLTRVLVLPDRSDHTIQLHVDAVTRNGGAGSSIWLEPEDALQVAAELIAATDNIEPPKPPLEAA